MNKDLQILRAEQILTNRCNITEPICYCADGNIHIE